MHCYWASCSFIEMLHCVHVYYFPSSFKYTPYIKIFEALHVIFSFVFHDIISSCIFWQLLRQPRSSIHVLHVTLFSPLPLAEVLKRAIFGIWTVVGLEQSCSLFLPSMAAVGQIPQTVPYLRGTFSWALAVRQRIAISILMSPTVLFVKTVRHGQKLRPVQFTGEPVLWVNII